MIIIYLVVSIWAFVLVYPLLRMYSVNKMSAWLAALLAIVGGIFLSNLLIKPQFLAWKYERDLRLNYPFVTYIAINSPKDFDAYMTKLRENVKTNRNLENEIYYQSELTNALLLKFGPLSSDAALYQYLQTNVAYDKKLILLDPIFVMFHEFPDKFVRQKINFSRLNRDDYFKATFDAVEKVVQVGVDKPHALPTPEEEEKAKAIFRAVVENISKQYGEQVVIETLRNPENPLLDKTASAKITIAFFEGILEKGEQDAGLFMRVAFFISRPKD